MTCTHVSRGSHAASKLNTNHPSSSFHTTVNAVFLLKNGDPGTSAHNLPNAQSLPWLGLGDGWSLWGLENMDSA
jgi:hypothetical protein